MSIVDAAFYLKDATVGVGNVFRDTVVRVCLSCCTVIVLLWVAILMYISFYYAYMPTVHHAQPVFLQFSSDCSIQTNDGLCSFPEANISLSKGDRILMRGQRYQVFLDLEMPQSPINEKLGMFMVTLKFMSHSGKVLATSSRSSMLHFRSGFLKGISTMFMSLPLILGFSEEKQVVAVKLFENYVDDSYHPVTKINVVISATRIEIYGASLRIEAEFSGFRYILFNWPITSALVCISTNFITACIIFFFAYHAFTPDPIETEPDVVQVTPDGQEQLYREARRRDLRSNDQRICRTPSPSPSNNTGRFMAKTLFSRTKAPTNSISSSHFEPIQMNPRTHAHRLRSASFPPCRWDSSHLQAATDKDLGKATRGPSSTPRRGREDLYNGVQVDGVEASADGIGIGRGNNRGFKGRNKVDTLTYSNPKKSNKSNQNTIYENRGDVQYETKRNEIMNKTKSKENKENRDELRNETKRNETFGKDEVTNRLKWKGTYERDGTENDRGNGRDEPQTTHLEKSLSFDSGVQQIFPTYTVLELSKKVKKDVKEDSVDQTNGQEPGLFMRRIPDGAPAESSHVQPVSLTRAKSEEYCIPREEEKTTVRKRPPNKIKSKFGSSFRKIIPRR